MARTIHWLRAEAQIAAVVDFNQIAPRGEEIDAARWHYSIAYRICRELRLKIDLQDWWHEKNLLLSEQRLVEFFQDVVLPHTFVPVTIFFDEAERAADLPFASDLFAAQHSCYMRRVSDPEFARLNFVVLGAASPDRLCPDSNVSPFIAGQSIQLEDFSLEECMALAPGFDQPEAVVESLLARICFWTHGQPYLTQKLARAVARRGSRPQDVDSVAHALFLAPGISREEPLLHHMRTLLTGVSPRRRQACSMIGRLARGQEVLLDPSSTAQRLLELAGVVSSDDNGMLRFRNRIVEQVIGGDPALWSRPDRWRRPAGLAAAALAVLAAVVLLPYWYLQILPRPDIAALETETDYASLESAYMRLGRLPGFGAVADRLFGDAMARRSANAESIADVRLADEALRGLPDGGVRADALLANFWLRRSAAAAAGSDRDSALVYALAAAEAGSPRAAEIAADLIDGDYRALEQTLHLDAPPLATAVDWARDQVVVVDSTRRVHRWALSAGDGEAVRTPRTLPERLTALEYVGMTRGFFVDEPGSAGAFELRVALEHGRTSDVLVRLTAPSGAAAEVELPQREGNNERFVITASAANRLIDLADESITGRWEITLFDRLTGEAGRLVSWGLRFSGVPQNWDDAPVDGLPLPDPVQSEQITVRLADDGRFGVALPSRPDARGAATVWDLTSGERIADAPLSDRDEGVLLIGSSRMLVFGTRRASLLDLEQGTEIAAFASANGFARQPSLSPDLGYFALAEAAGDGIAIGVYQAADGSRLGALTTGPLSDWILAPGAAYVAGIDGSRRGRVFDPASGSLVTEFFGERELSRLARGGSPDHIVAVDSGGDIFAWPLAAAPATLSPRESVFLGNTSVPASMAIAAAAPGLAFADSAGLVTVVSPADGHARGTFEHGDNRNLGTWLDPAAARLVSVSDTRLRQWRLADDQAEASGFGIVSAVALDASGELGVLGFRSGGAAMLRDVAASIATGTAAEAATGNRGVVTSLAVNATGDLAASGDSDGVVRVWDARTGERVPFLLRHPTGPAGALAFSSDDRWLVSAGPRQVRIFALDSGDLVNEIRVDGRPLAIAIDADNRIVAIGDSSGNIVLAALDGSTGEISVRGSSPITALSFAGEPGLLASGSANGDVVLWDTLTVAPIGGAYSFRAPVGWIRFSAAADAIHVRSGGWLHTLARSGDQASVVGSRLLPDRLRTQPSLALIRDGSAVRVLANAGGGRLALEELELPRPPAADAAVPPAEFGPDLPPRDWRRVLGMNLDAATGSIRRSGL